MAQNSRNSMKQWPIHKTCVAVILFLVLASCRENNPRNKSARVNGDSDSQVTFEEREFSTYENCSFELTFRDSILFDTPSELPIGYLSMVSQDASNNFVVGGLGQHVLVFDSLGSFLWSAGQFGGGPGEYSSNYVFDTDPNGTLYIVDNVTRRIHQYADSKEYVRSAALPHKSSIRNISAFGENHIFLLNEDYRLRDLQPYSILRFSLAEERFITWGKIDAISILQTFLQGGGVSIDPNRKKIYYGYMGDYLIHSATFDGTHIGVLNSKPKYFVKAEKDLLLEYFDQDPSEFPQSVNGYSIGVSWVIALEVSSTGFIFQQILKKLDEDPVEMYLEVWDADGRKVTSQVETPDELLHVDTNTLYFRIDLEEENDRYGVAKYTSSLICES
ncbi:MAG: 6-bladed beta-propeller [Rhodothermaceae bacterium]|nr:6-bladed beta-propeller [Rhodothermaceae bacterium]MXZ59104.1 6-bladed beta-propeller [Rhodothermaceae bacterium]MYB90317.1 6-bladed beta-propeller [Rhodothermaceae bacterium]MYD68507.1 6-bladed beta-propeller [Rhodothermaceae bacterium]MYG45638.1 6-bladed beta-propeller [Rhodothermaceae bacterium]